MVEDVLLTEAGGDPTAGYERRSTAELVELMNAADSAVPEAVAAASASIASAIDAIVERLRRGGRLVYVGAGSSGAIGALDASECEATFATLPGLVVALVAGGGSASAREQMAAEDDRGAGISELQALGIVADDCVVGVTASGGTPYVLGALTAAGESGALTACVVSTPGSELASIVDHEIAVLVGPEFLAGSTRLKAGTAQKLVLNTISTVSMIRLGKTYGNLMVDVVAANEKLRGRVRRIVQAATGASSDDVEAAVAAADGDARVAIVSLLADVDAPSARARLEASDRSISDALEQS
jgi:N-acetylmuramic acid 6-phosphate etherase